MLGASDVMTTLDESINETHLECLLIKPGHPNPIEDNYTKHKSKRRATHQRYQ